MFSYPKWHVALTVKAAITVSFEIKQKVDTKSGRHVLLPDMNCYFIDIQILVR